MDAGHAGRDVADDPMLLKLVASIPAIRTAEELAMGPLSPVRAVAASSEDGAPDRHLRLRVVVRRRMGMGRLRIRGSFWDG